MAEAKRWGIWAGACLMPHFPKVSDCDWVRRVCASPQSMKSRGEDRQTSRAGKGACRPAALRTEDISLLKKDKPGEKVGRKSPETGKPYGSPKSWLEKNLLSAHKKKVKKYIYTHRGIFLCSTYCKQNHLGLKQRRENLIFPGGSTEGTGGYLLNDATACKNKKERRCPRNGAGCRDAERAEDGNTAKRNDPSSAPPPSLHPPMNQPRGAERIPISSTTTKTSFN